jgi:hypothetical protein
MADRRLWRAGSSDAGALGKQGVQMGISVKVAASLVSAAISISSAFAGSPGSSTFDAKAKSGIPSRVKVFFNCTTHYPKTTGAFADHGTVTLKEVTRKNCGNDNEPAVEMWYTSAAGYKGPDTLSIPYGGGQFTRINVDVN